MSIPSTPDLELRKHEVRSILSLFSSRGSADVFRSDVYNQIDTGQGKRSSEWTIPGDLEGSLMQWAVHDDNCYFCLLTLSSNLQPPDLEAWNRKKIEVRDILSSFDRESLPEEYRADVFQQIELIQTNRSYSRWTIPGDIEGSLMQWAVYNENFYNFLRKCQSPETRAILFDQKISRRLHDELTTYELLPKWEGDGQVIDLSSSEARKKVSEIAERVRDLVQMAHRDFETRQQVPGDRSNRAKPIIHLLRQICESRKEFPATQRGTKQATRSSQTTGSASLFHHLVYTPQPDLASGFLLDMLETFSEQLLNECKQDLNRIAQLLKERKAPQVYIDRYLRTTTPALRQLTEGEYRAVTDTQERTASQTVGSSQTGSKRPAAESSGRRGRRRTTK